jgi:hypothetical protein
MKSPVCLSGPRPPRPRWRSQGRRRSTTQRSRPQRSEGQRQGGFLGSRGMRDPGSPGDLSPGVVNRGPGATCRVGWSRRGRKLPDAVAAKAIEAQPSFGQIKPGEDAWNAAPRQAPRRSGTHATDQGSSTSAAQRTPQREGRSRRIRSDPSSRCLRLGNEALARPEELPRQRHSSAKHARCSPAVRSALVPASETPCRAQPTADDHRSDISARSGRSLERVLCVRDRARRVETAKQVRAQPTSPGRMATPNSS